MQMLSPLVATVSFLFLLITSVEGVLVNVTVDDSLPDPVTGRLITYRPDSAWKAGVECTDCTTNVDSGSMLDRTWHDGTYFPANSNLPPTGPLNATFTFNGTAIYVFCALALSVSSPTGYSNMSFFIDNQLVGHFERVPPGQQDYRYNVSVYSNTTIPAGEHTFMLQNGQFGDMGNKSLTLLDYLVYSYDDGKPATPTSSSTSQNAGSSSNVGAIAGGVVGGIVGLLALGLLLWFLRRRRSQSRKMNEKNYSFSSLSPTRNSHTIPEPFTEGVQTGPVSSTDFPQTSHVPSVGYGIGVSKNAQSQQRYIAPSNASSVPSASVDPSSTASPPQSAGIPGRARQRETDAGPIAEDGQEEQEETLPPDYGQVFAGASAAAPQQSGSTVPSRKS